MERFFTYILRRWKSEFGLRQSDLGRLVEMMIQFKSMGEIDLGGFEDLRDSVEKVGLAKLTELMSEVRGSQLISSALAVSQTPHCKKRKCVIRQIEILGKEH